MFQLRNCDPRNLLKGGWAEGVGSGLGAGIGAYLARDEGYLHVALAIFLFSTVGTFVGALLYRRFPRRAPVE